MTAEQPLISVIIPLYNSEKYIAECIKSVLEQSWSNVEVIVVDDGSTDNSLAVAKGFEAENVKVLSQQNNGASAARNKGLQEATGDYIQFLDADDLLRGDKLLVSFESLAGHSNAISVCPVIHFNNQDLDHLSQLRPSAYELEFYKTSTDPFEFLLNLYGVKNNRSSMIPLHCWLTPANLIKKAGKWDESLTVNDDGEFFCRVILQAQKIVFTDQTVCYYRKYSNTTSVSAGKSDKDLESQYKAIMLKKQHLERFKADERIDRAIVHDLVNLLMTSYPANGPLSKKISAQIKEYKIKVVPPTIGGAKIELIKNVFGWKIARLIQHYIVLK